jgi:hypothetical protein
MWLAALIGGAGVAGAERLLGTPTNQALGAGSGSQVSYLPVILQPGTVAPTRPRVAHVRNAAATFWDGSGYYYAAVRQDVVDAMVQSGLQRLTAQSTWPDIWRVLFTRVRPGGYAAGQKVAIKVNLNNNVAGSTACDTHGNVIDALPHPILGLIRGMVQAGVRPGDITLYDSIRAIPAYLRNPIVAAYPGVQFIGRGECTGTTLPGYGKDSSLTVHFNDPPKVLKDRHLVDILYDATYLINVPIIKRHSGDTRVPVTLGFKNHFGTIDRISALPSDLRDDLHSFVSLAGSEYRSTYNPWVDIYSNPNIRNKTVLTLGDGLFGAFGVSQDAAKSWKVFGGPANSLFFATDPVAIDCVMADFIVAEGLVTKAHTYDYLFCAQEAGLGVCEGTRAAPGGNPLRKPYGSGYAKIEYVREDA